ncbi:Cobalamin biosynthesis protein CbiK, Co2+ chelatase [Butyrivibrio hungatei]|uniref:Cobalamin biosynthesis protein CbiK, Co2+ chelatase n=1 Tax=Butyrivibrio hungatei TaxID=185008 RepID=A0A1G5AKY8_9FIRM|nr:sirohydrochlorin cobaltochelatase [Butyrivibrio hungatei]SCX78552.1 Cobalamin biosynthesis protein CbiK, Co2+ chelatase [Butyrivibrio hungatei]
MKKKTLALLLATALCVSMFAGCGKAQTEAPADGASAEVSSEETNAASSEASDAESANGELADGTYTASFNTDSSMFHVNEANDGKGTLTVKDGKMTIHVSLASNGILNLFCGTAEDAQKEGAELLQPTNDTVTYEDGTTEEVNGFDIPVPAIDEEFDVALIGKKEKWYDHKVSVSDVKPEASDEDQAAADNVAKLIDAIYVQERTDKTDEQCAEAKKAWDALTDSQKELVEGEEADPDYFGRDTGDASKDDALNADKIGDKEILVVSFGTSFNESRVEDISGVEKALAAAYPDYAVRRAFTAQIIINHVLARDNEAIDNVDQALERAVNNGVKELIVQPTHLMHGAEYDELMDALKKYESKFTKVAVAEPLLGEVGKDASVINKDKETVAKAVVAEAVKTAKFDSIEAADKDGTAFVLMGHGTSHTANVTYSQMQTQMDKLGYKNVFIGTVEGEPEETELSKVIEKVKAAGYKKVVLRPLMVVAGDHANNDMAGDDADSWKSGFEASGAFEKIDCQISGLGRIADVQKLYVEHTGAVIK